MQFGSLHPFTTVLIFLVKLQQHFGKVLLRQTTLILPEYFNKLYSLPLPRLSIVLRWRVEALHLLAVQAQLRAIALVHQLPEFLLGQPLKESELVKNYSMGQQGTGGEIVRSLNCVTAFNLNSVKDWKHLGITFQDCISAFWGLSSLSTPYSQPTTVQPVTPDMRKIVISRKHTLVATTCFFMCH